MKNLTISEYAALHGLNPRTVRNYCLAGKLPGAEQNGKFWTIPADAPVPTKGKHSRTASPLLAALRAEQQSHTQGGIYHRTQIDLTYNSNHIEGSRLSHDQTRFIYETATIGFESQPVRVDDVIETVNHFRCIDMIILRAEEPISHSLVKDLHRQLKAGTQDSTRSWFAVGDYKQLPNEVGGVETTAPELVYDQLTQLFSEYNAIPQKSLDDLLTFHTRFERIHPFQDGNGRVGRLLLFKECLANDITPFIIADDLKLFYYRGLQHWFDTPGYLRDTCLTAQDRYAALLQYFRIL